jgi:hypothetical protein
MSATALMGASRGVESILGEAIVGLRPPVTAK